MKEIITMSHGNGGRLMHELVEKIRSRLSNPVLDEMADAAEVKVSSGRIVFSTDSYVIRPLFFPGGDIGKLAVCGTVNDISMKGARPLYLSLAFIIEEGFEEKTLLRIVDSIKLQAQKAGVSVVTGDLKVVERGGADGLYINTAGIGCIDDRRIRICSRAKAGDAIVLNGALAEHGLAVLNARQEFGFKSSIKSDCTNLNFIVQKCVGASKKISVMRDLTRGGLATSLNEIAHSSNLGIKIVEDKIPVKKNVKHLCEALGFDPFYIANEGKFICFVDPRDAGRVRTAMGKDAAIIGTVTRAHSKEVHLITPIGSSRMLPMLESDQLPRIC